MPRCKICDGCWFYRTTKSPECPGFDLLKKYCHGDYLACSRFQFAQYLGIRYLPRQLQPQEFEQMEGVVCDLTSQ